MQYQEFFYRFGKVLLRSEQHMEVRLYNICNESGLGGQDMHCGTHLRTAFGLWSTSLRVLCIFTILSIFKQKIITLYIPIIKSLHAWKKGEVFSWSGQ